MLIYKLWATIEAYDTETDDHYDLDPEIVQFKVGEFLKVEDVAAFAAECWEANDPEEVIEEIKTVLEEI